MLQYTTLQYTTIHYTNYTTPQLQLQLHYSNYTTLQLQLKNTTPLHYNYTYNYTTPHYIQQLWWGDHCNHCNHSRKQCHPWFTTTNLSYRFPIFATGTVGIYHGNLESTRERKMCTYKLCGYTRRVYTHHKEARHSWLHSWVRGCQGMSVPDVHRHGWKLGSPKQAGSMTAKVPSPLSELAVGCPALS